MKFGQLREYNNKNYAENEAGRLAPDHFLLFKKALWGVKASDFQRRFK